MKYELEMQGTINSEEMDAFFEVYTNFISCVSYHDFRMFGMFVFVSYHLGFQYGMGTDMRTVYLISISLHHFRVPKVRGSPKHWRFLT